jgi:hypothetical protein
MFELNPIPIHGRSVSRHLLPCTCSWKCVSAIDHRRRSSSAIIATIFSGGFAVSTYGGAEGRGECSPQLTNDRSIHS